MIPHAALKEKHRRLRDTWSEPLSLRVHRALSWLGRAEQETGDADLRFILLWIGFNAAYAADIGDQEPNERRRFERYFAMLCQEDSEQRIYAAVWQRFPHEIRLLADNHFLFAPFWRHANGDPDAANWEERLRAARHELNMALAHRQTAQLLAILFDRLYMLRNQMVHGGATWNSAVNRDQLRDGAAVLATLLPLFIDTMMDHPHIDWGRPYYPVIS